MDTPGLGRVFLRPNCLDSVFENRRKQNKVYVKNPPTPPDTAEPGHGPSSSTRFPVGTIFKTGGRHPRTCTVEDMLTTRNLAGDVVGIRYVASHEFMGQTVRDYDVNPVTIARGFVSFPVAEAEEPPQPSPVEEAEAKARRAFQTTGSDKVSAAATHPAMPPIAERRGVIRLG